MGPMNDHQSKREDSDPKTKPEKRAYRTPEVRRMGTVAELTLGSSGSAFDGAPGDTKPQP
jgi:hypothetical protein